MQQTRPTPQQQSVSENPFKHVESISSSFSPVLLLVPAHSLLYLFSSSLTSFVAFYRRDVIEGGKVESQFFPDRGYYNISIELEAFDYQLDAENMFECVLTIPGTEFEMHEEILYFPGA